MPGAWADHGQVRCLNVLIAVVDAGSLSAGARALRAPLPSVSRKMPIWTHHLGTKLLYAPAATCS
jgi:DNA-binding transcriptional LysR family regulator